MPRRPGSSLPPAAEQDRLVDLLARVIEANQDLLPAGAACRRPPSKKHMLRSAAMEEKFINTSSKTLLRAVGMLLLAGSYVITPVEATAWPSGIPRDHAEPAGHRARYRCAPFR